MFVWHIDRAKFVFDDPTEYETWKQEKKVFFEIDPSASDDGLKMSCKTRKALH